ncbi:MAG: hypothetical protein U9N81_13415 [Bacillota bacterium]|nr:hypothetical protein [Bacillota bacterium]
MKYSIHGFSQPRAVELGIKGGGSFSYYGYAVNYETLVYLRNNPPTVNLLEGTAELLHPSDETTAPPAAVLPHPSGENTGTKINILNNPSIINNSTKESER